MLRWALAFGFLVSTASAVQCLDEDGDEVAWWFIYKMPNGFRYAYMDSNDKATQLKPFTDRTLDRLDGALGDTLHQIYVDKKGLAYALYNDEPPAESKTLLSVITDFLFAKSTQRSNGAHAKGVVASDADGGFWLVHSVPKFPDLGPPTFTWTADDTYGQSFLCMSLTVAGINQVGTQLQYFHPLIFSSNMPSALAKKLPKLADVINGDRISGTNVEELTVSDGHSFTSFAKDEQCNSDLYTEMVSPTLQVGFDWETWRRGGECPSICESKSDYAAINVMAMKIGPVAFGYTKDHAKLGIATSGDDSGGYVCVGDINRMESQRKREGGLCVL